MSDELEARLAALVLSRLTFTADDLTNCGQDAVDDEHRPNGRQSAIGATFNQASRRGYIIATGAVTRSAAKHRKGGLIRVWTATQTGVRWAMAHADRGVV